MRRDLVNNKKYGYNVITWLFSEELNAGVVPWLQISQIVIIQSSSTAVPNQPKPLEHPVSHIQNPRKFNLSPEICCTMLSLALSLQDGLRN